MPKFSELSTKRLESCHKDLQLIFLTAVQDFDCSIICGHRTEQEQERVYREGKSQLRYPESKHNSFPSMAVDVAPYPIDWVDKPRFYFFAGYVKRLAEELLNQKLINHRLRWGGDWDGDSLVNDQSFYDLPHFELVEEED